MISTGRNLGYRLQAIGYRLQVVWAWAESTGVVERLSPAGLALPKRLREGAAGVQGVDRRM